MNERLTTFIQLIISAAALCLVVAAGLLSIYRAPSPARQPAAAETFPLQPQALAAEAAIVYDPGTKQVLFSKNDEEQLPLASLTKLMTADVALGERSATSSVRISRAAIATEGDSGLKAGETWKLGELLRYSLLVSSNDGMAAVAESGGGGAFIKKMNANAERLGLAQSYFLDPTGLDMTLGVSGAYGSARDVALLAAAFYASHPSIFESTVRTGAAYEAGGGVLTGKPTATPILDIPGLIGAKTGYTDLAGGNLVAVFDRSIGHPLVAVVLHSTEKGRFEDIRALIEAARSSADRT